MNPSPTPQADPRLYWNGPAGLRWVSEQAVLDRMLEPFGRATLARAAVATGERIIDVGCGCGTTTLLLAQATGPTGAVTGVDISAPMIAVAREALRGLPHVQLVEADATTLRLDAPADLLFSRFGVMFFPDPAAAFANLVSLLRPGGRLAFVCWRPLAENAWASVPFVAANRVVGNATPLDASGPGPFSFADPGIVRGLLEGAGLTDVALEGFDHGVVLGESLDEAVEHALFAGPAARLLADADAATRARAREAVRTELAQRATQATNEGVSLGAATWLVTARRRDSER